MDQKQPPSPVSPIDSSRKVYYRLVGLLIAFVLGAISVIAFRYLFYGKTLQLSPDVFISMVFTIAIGAASLVLALLAISYGRISERVITERSDRSIEIQMSLFEKSLDLQTRLFDKTMSTLESIGRSTGVTEQRMGDMLSMFQNPTFMKQVAGRAVEETATELGRESKEGGMDAKAEAKLAETLTQNIVRELSARFEEGEYPSSRRRVLRRSAPEASAELAAGLEAENKTLQEQIALVRKAADRLLLVRKILQTIPEAAIQELKPQQPWDVLVEYKGKKVALDVRTRPPNAVNFTDAYDGSIKLLLSHPIDALVFVHVAAGGSEFLREFQARNQLMGGRLRYIVGDEESSLRNELIGVLESVAAPLPSPEPE